MFVQIIGNKPVRDKVDHFPSEFPGMRMGKMYELMYYIEAGGGTGSLDCTYFFMSDGRI